MTLWVIAVGMNYTGTPYVLKGCVNDAKNTCEFLRRKYGARSENIFVMTDDIKGKMFPSADNVKTVMTNVFKRVKAEDVVYLHISGHGFNVKSGNGSAMTSSGGKISASTSQCVLLRNNKDSKDIDESNTMCGEQFNQLLSLVPKGMKLFGVIDTCNSGSVFELTHNIRVMSKEKCTSFCPIVDDTDITYYLTNNDKHSCYLGDIVILSSVKTKQVAWDTVDEKGVPCGAFTSLFLKLLETTKSDRITPLELLYKLDLEINKKYKQDPSLACCNIDLINQPFLARS